MRFLWTFLAGGAVLGTFFLIAQILAPNSALAQFSSAPSDSSNPILRLPPPPKAGAPLFPTPQKPAATQIVAAPKAMPTPRFQARFVGQNPLRVGLSTAGSEIRIYFPGGATVWENTLFRSKIGAGDIVTIFSQSQSPKNVALQMESGQKISAGQLYFAVNGEPARVTTNGKNARYGRPYRGDLEVFPQRMGEPIKRKGPLALVNVLPIESYLKGVVPWEMSPSAPLEALKAQAICARTKTLDFIRSKRFAAGKFDICDYDACQGYPGTENEKPLTTKAVESTKGLAIYHNNRPIDAVYSTNSGGVTANARDVWLRGAPIPYLQSVADFSPDSPLAKLWQGGMNEAKWAQFCAENFASFARPDGVASDKYEARKYRWTQFISVDEASKAFIAEGISRVLDIQVIERSPSGRIRRLQVSGIDAARFKTLPTPIPPPQRAKNDDAGGLGPTIPIKKVDFEGDGKIRAVFSKRLGSTTALPSSLFTVSPATDSRGQISGWNLQGAGWGHGVGMCQRGAQNRALQGWDARKILNHYYRGVQIR